MPYLVGIRREDKSEWERRVPVTPQDAALLQREHDVQCIIQPSEIRAFEDGEFRQACLPVQEDLSACPVVLGIKEMPLEVFQPGKAYVFFAHVIKGQPYNMPMLRRLLDLGCTLIDYERVVDDGNRRLIFFGWHAGVAGMIDTLWALGQRLSWEDIESPFSGLAPTHTYRDLAAAKVALGNARARIEAEGLPPQASPLIVGVAGYGNVSRGVQEMLDLLPVIEVAPEQVAAVAADSNHSRHHVYKVVFKEWHMVEPVDPHRAFELQDYYQYPERYRGVFEQYLPHLSVLVNAIYWTSAYPRLVTKEALATLFREGRTRPGGDNSRPKSPRLRVIGDVSCDVEGAIECTVKATEPGDPIYVYNPLSGAVRDGHAGEGVVIMAVDILPSELPREASADFSRVLKPFIPALARCNYSAPFQACDLPAEIKRAVIAWQGRLTPDYEYVSQYLP